jgi:hypothetical protein
MKTESFWYKVKHRFLGLHEDEKVEVAGPIRSIRRKDGTYLGHQRLLGCECGARFFRIIFFGGYSPSMTFEEYLNEYAGTPIRL